MNFGGVIHLNKSGICIICGGLLVFFIYMVTSSRGNIPSTEKINLNNLFKVAIKAAKNGGKEVVASKDNLNIKSKGLTKEGMQDSVTTADYLSHCSIVKTLKHTYPTLNVISEEAKTECDSNQVIDYTEITEFVPNVKDHWVDLTDVTVWIDPLDATHEYTEKLYDFVTTMVCVAVKGRPIIGVIHKPFSKDDSGTYWAWVNKIRSSNLQAVKRESDKLKIIISRSHSGEIRKVLSENLKSFDLDNLVIAAGAGYKALEVATGAVDAYLHITAIKKWDICAGNAIIDSMGGKMTTKYGELIDYKDATDVKNERGLIATLKNHDSFIGKIETPHI